MCWIAHLQPVPIGIAGELYVGGIGVGRGYLNDPEQTRRSFLRDPFSKRRGARLYRTGDLARWRADGTLECFGRIDHQVKIRGCRIELEEIEHVLMEHPGVQSAVAMARDNMQRRDATDRATLSPATDERPEANELRDFLKTRLPAHMIPAGYVFLDHLPLTAHGKLDRPALAAFGSAAQSRGQLILWRHETPPRRSWPAYGRICLGPRKSAFSSNFFDLGGHSLLAGRVLARVASVFRVSLPIRALFEATTVEALARRIDEARATQSTEPRPEMTRVERDGPQPVSILQEHVLRIERELPGTAPVQPALRLSAAGAAERPGA